MNKLLLLVPALILFGCLAPDYGPLAQPTDDGTMNYASDSSPVMYFYSENCHYCKLQKPILQELSKEGYRVKLMDIGADSALAQRYSVTATPTFIAADGAIKVGLMQKDELRSWLGAHGAKIA